MLKKKPLVWLSLLLAFGLVAAACGDDDDRAPRATTEATPPRPRATARPTSRATSTSPARPPSSPSPPPSARAPRLLRRRRHRRRPRHRRRLRAVLRRRDRHLRRLPPDQGGGGAACADAGIEFIELKVAFDGISVLTNPANDAVECLSFADLYALIGPESEGFDNWSDAQDARHRAGLDHRAPRRRARPSPPPAPSRAPTTASSSSPSATSPRPGSRPARSPRTRSRRPAPTTPSQADDNAIIAGIEGRATPARLGRLRLRRGGR